MKRQMACAVIAAALLGGCIKKENVFIKECERAIKDWHSQGRNYKRVTIHESERKASSNDDITLAMTATSIREQKRQIKLIQQGQYQPKVFIADIEFEGLDKYHDNPQIYKIRCEYYSLTGNKENIDYSSIWIDGNKRPNR